MRGILASTTLALLGLALANGGSRATGAEAARSRGDVLFENRCARCHGLAADGADGLAPSLSGVVGSSIAARKDYVYSDALRKHGGVWSSQTLDAYLADPQAFAPGADMDVHSPDPAEREAIIDYLRTLK